MAYPVNETDENGLPLDNLNRSGGVRGEAWLNQADIDREIYGSRFGFLFGESRINNTADTTHLRPYRNPGANWYVPVIGAMFSVPDVLPGSNNIRTNGSGATPGTRGEIAFRAYAQSCEMEVGLRQVVLDGAGGFLAVGAYSRYTFDFTATFGPATPGWWDTQSTTPMLLPADTTGAGFVGPGDLIQYYVAFKQNDGLNPGYVFRYHAFEPNLLNANP